MRAFSLSAAELLERIIASGAQLRLVGDELQIKTNGREDRRLQEEIKRNKTGLTKLVQEGEHKWHPVETWSYRREGNRMIGKRLDEAGETSWGIKPFEKNNAYQLPLWKKQGPCHDNH